MENNKPFISFLASSAEKPSPWKELSLQIVFIGFSPKNSYTL